MSTIQQIALQQAVKRTAITMDEMKKAGVGFKTLKDLKKSLQME